MKKLWLLTVLLASIGSAWAGDTPRVLANHLLMTCDDFVIDVYHNGKVVPDSKRSLVLERFGATVERIDVTVHEGDWLVFNPVNNRLRWGGVQYFAVAGCISSNDFGFTSNLTDGQWAACDDLKKVEKFIRSRSFQIDSPVQAIAKPWEDGDKLMRKYAGNTWDGDAIWGQTRNTWMKVLVGDAAKGRKEKKADKKSDRPRS